MSFAEVISDLERATAERVRHNEGDYIKGGLLYCGNCNTPKQTKLEVLGITKTPYCLCKCETEARDREIAKQKQAAFIAKLTEQWEKWGFRLHDVQKCTFANDDMANPRISQAMQRYVENFPEFKKQGQGLLLYGNVGTGKTFLAVAVANALIAQGYSVLVTNFAQRCNVAGGLFEGKQQFYNYLNKFALLVIDDLAAERKTEYMSEIVYNVIDSRYRAGLPMIITTNLTPTEIKNPKDIANKRIYDRILERCHPIAVEGSNRRHKKVKDSYSSLNDLLGL